MFKPQKFNYLHIKNMLKITAPKISFIKGRVPLNFMFTIGGFAGKNSKGGNGASFMCKYE